VLSVYLAQRFASKGFAEKIIHETRKRLDDGDILSLVGDAPVQFFNGSWQTIISRRIPKNLPFTESIDAVGTKLMALLLVSELSFDAIQASVETVEKLEKQGIF